MSKNINVNPDHYKVAGRERQGEDVVATEHKQKFGNVQHDLAARAEQRNRSLEQMRARQTRPAREDAARRPPQSRATKATKKAPPVDEEGDAGGEPRRRIGVPAAIRNAAAGGAARVTGSRAAKITVRKASKAVKKTRRAAVTTGTRAAALSKAAAAKAKKAVARRPKQALPKKGAKAVPVGAMSRPARKK